MRNIDILFRRQSGLCHYCNNRCTRQPDRKNSATKEHVVPKAYGGINGLDNYVMACGDCNNKRGTALFYCRCDFCAPLIDKAMESPAFINHIFKGIAKHSKPIVFWHRNNKMWTTRIGHGSKGHASWQDAIDYAFNWKVKV